MQGEAGSTPRRLQIRQSVGQSFVCWVGCDLVRVGVRMQRARLSVSLPPARILSMMQVAVGTVPCGLSLMMISLHRAQRC